MQKFALCLLLANLVAAGAVHNRTSGKSLMKSVARVKPQFRYDYEYRHEICGWVKLEQVPATWKDAYLNCYYEGAVLLSPETKLKWHVMRVLINGDAFSVESQSIHTGIHATFGTGAFQSVEGTPLLRMPVEWAVSQPAAGGDSLAMLQDGTLTSINSTELRPYICYKENKSVELNECGTIDKEYTLDKSTGSCYKVHTDPLNWYEAFSACSHEGGYLAIINSAAEAQVLSQLATNAQPRMVAGTYRKDALFIGITNFRDHVLWMTIHGQTLREAGYDGWAKDEPSDNYTGGLHGCGTMYYAGTLDDTSCLIKLAFICEMTPFSLITPPQPVCQTPTSFRN